MGKKKRRHSTDSDPESEDESERIKVVKRNPAIREDESKNGNRMSAKDMFAREERNGRLSNVRDKVRDGGESRGRQSAEKEKGEKVEAYPEIEGSEEAYLEKE